MSKEDLLRLGAYASTHSTNSSGLEMFCCENDASFPPLSDQIHEAPLDDGTIGAIHYVICRPYLLLEGAATCTDKAERSEHEGFPPH